MADPTDDELRALGVEDDADLSALGVVDEAPGPESISPEPYGPMARPIPADPGYLASFGHSLLSGYAKQGSDESVGAITRAAVDSGNGAAWKQPDGSVRFLDTPGDVYRAGRDSERETLAGAREHHPYLSFAGGLIGDVASDATLKAFGVPVTSQAYQTAMGGVSGLLGSDADLTTGNAENYLQAAGATGTGMALGYTAPIVGRWLGKKAGQGAGWVGQKTSEAFDGSSLQGWLQNTAFERAVKAATGQNKKVIRTMIQKGMIDAEDGTIDTVGEDLLQQGVVTPGASTADIMQRAGERMNEAGKAISRSLQELDALSPTGATFGQAASAMGKAAPRGARMSAEALADQIEAAIVAPGFNGTRGQGLVAERISQELEALRVKGPDVSLEEMEGFKRGLDKSIDWARVNAPPAMEALRRMRTMINVAIEGKADEIAEAAGSNASQTYRAAKRVYGSMKLAQDAARDEVTGQLSNRLVSPSDYGSGATGALLAAFASGGNIPASLATGAAMAGVNKLARTRGNQVAAPALNALAQGDWLDDLARTNPEALGKWGAYLGAAASRSPEALSQAKHELGQLDPEYQEERRRQGGLNQ